MQKHLSLSLLKSSLALAIVMVSANALGAHSFLERVQENYSRLERGRNESSPRSPSEPSYLAITELFRGQDEISVDNSMAKVLEREKLEHIRLLSSQGEFDKNYSFSFDHGRSALPPDDPVDVVKGPQGYLVIDGHHEVYMSLFAGAETVPVRINMDLSHLSPKAFWSLAKERNLVYYKPSTAEKMTEVFAQTPPRIDLAQDNPHRYLVSLLGMKVKIDSNQVVKTKGSDSPVWIKLPNERPFIEFYLAKVLADAGIDYQTTWGETIPSETIEKARQALLKAQETNSHPYAHEVTILSDSETATRARGNLQLTQELIERDRSRKCMGLFR